MDRGAIVYSCTRDTMDEAALKRAMAILRCASLLRTEAGFGGRKH